MTAKRLMSEEEEWKAENKTILMQKIFNWTKTFVGKIIAVIATIVVVMTFVDYLLKWQIYPYFLDIFAKLLGLLYQFAFESFVLLCLSFLFFLFWKLKRRVENSKSDELEKQIANQRITVDAQIKKLSESTANQIKSVENRFNDKFFDIQHTIVEFEIEHHRSKGQVGEVSKMIEKLEMDLKRRWGAENTLLEIREYIKKSGMPNYFLDDLHKTLEKLPNSMKGIGEEILKLAQERLYNPR